MSTPVTMNGSSSALYELRGVERRYQRGGVQVLAVHDVDLDIAAGDFVSVEGPSGSGKTTLLQLLGALDAPTQGTITFDGQQLGEADDDVLTDMRARLVGFVFQQFNLIPTLTAQENVAVAMEPLKVKAHERRARALEVLEQVGLSARADHLPSRLSGGEQQRVAVARALANRPRVIVADEPTGNLDTRNARDVMDLLGRLRADTGVTVVVATHDADVAGYARRRIHMRDGEVVEDTSS